MTNAPSTRATVSMKGGGYYSQHTRGAKDVIDKIAALSLAALEETDISNSASPLEAPFAIADYGAADGGTSVDMIRALVGAVRARTAERPITVTYTDLPRNDFSALFAMIDGQREDIESYTIEHDGVYVFASGTSFYRQILPNAALDFGFSATAMHWLSSAPGTISDHVHAVGASGSELEAFRERALGDWETILLHRARELKPGGRLVVAGFCIDENGHYLGHTGGVNMFDTFDALWRGLAEEGAITPEEYRRTAFPQFYKTLEEHVAPLRNPSSPVYKAGLRLVKGETGTVQCPYAAQFKRDGDANAFATAYVPTLRSWSENVFMTGLDASRPLTERQALVDEFYGRYTNSVRENPDGHAMDYVHTYIVAARQ